MADQKAPKQADPPKTPSKSPDQPDRRTTWRHGGEYPALYFLPDRTSSYIEPGEVIDWGEQGPPDGHWERADPLAKSNDAKEE